MESIEDNKYTKIEFTNGRTFIMDLDIEDFVAKVFSDENLEKEYVLIELDDQEQSKILVCDVS